MSNCLCFQREVNYEDDVGDHNVIPCVIPSSMSNCLCFQREVNYEDDVGDHLQSH